jgi:hypothetical protein
METREYFEKVMQDYNQNGKGRSLRKYCKDEAVDYNWLMEFKKTYSASKPQTQQPVQSFISLSLEEETPRQMTWEVKMLQLQSPEGDSIEIKSNNLYAVSELLRKLS